MSIRYQLRDYDRAAYESLMVEGCDARFARLLASRDIGTLKALHLSFQDLIHPWLLKNNEAAGHCIAEGILAGKRFLVVGDYDCDGACAVAIAVRGLRMMGAIVSYLIPDRLSMSYGLSTHLLTQISEDDRPDILITVDNGISSHEAVCEARRLGMVVIITDHHLPAEVLPDAEYIVNPHQAGCSFPAKTLAGSGVIFYVLLSVRIALRKYQPTWGEVNLSVLLDLVCMGTLADLVPLDQNNRILVSGGLQRIRQGLSQPGVAALFVQARCDAREASQRDLVYTIIPRINAAGRLSEIGVAVTCLLSDDPTCIADTVKRLERFNRQRRLIEKRLYAEALSQVRTLPSAAAYVLYEPHWHLGLVGLVANRMKDVVSVPVLVLGRAHNGEMRGSGRAPKGYHLREILSRVAQRIPAAMTAYGGHALAVGLSVSCEYLSDFQACFVEEAARYQAEDTVVMTDGPLGSEDLSVDFVQRLRRFVWGKTFPAPLFCNYCEVISCTALGAYHRRLQIRCAGRVMIAYQWYPTQPMPNAAWCVYEVDWDFLQGGDRVALTILATTDQPPEGMAECPACVAELSLSVSG